MCAYLVTQSFPTFCDHMDCNLPGSSVHGIFQAKILEWVSIFYSMGPSGPRDGTRVPESSVLAGRCVATVPPCCHCCSVTRSWPTLFDPMDCSSPSSPVLPCLPAFAQTHVHWVSDATQLSHFLSSPSPPVLSLSQYHSLFQWVSSSHQVDKVLEFPLQHQSFQWIFRTDFL